MTVDIIMVLVLMVVMPVSSVRQRKVEVNKALMGMKIEKTGFNKHKGFRYYELIDILPPVLSECYKRGLDVDFPFVEGVAILKIVDLEDEKQYLPYRIEIPEVIVPEKNPNNQIIQAVGADITYLQRYLLKLAFPALSDKDMVDSGLFDTNTASSDNNETSDKSDKKEEPEVEEPKVADLQMGKLVLEAKQILEAKGLSEKEITYKALKNTILRMNQWSVPERRCILNYFKEMGGSK